MDVDVWKVKDDSGITYLETPFEWLASLAVNQLTDDWHKYERTEADG